MLTMQQIFDKGLAHIRAQGRASVRDDEEGDGCAYRNKAGLACAIGGFIADRDYKPEWDAGRNGSVVALLQTDEDFQYALRDLYRPDDTDETERLKLLEGMQWSHDWASCDEDSFVSEFERKMQAVADQHGLEYKAPTIEGALA